MNDTILFILPVLLKIFAKILTYSYFVHLNNNQHKMTRYLN